MDENYLINNILYMFDIDDCNKKVYKSFNPNDISDVKFYPPVVKMTFKDGTTTTAKAQGADKYNKEIGMMICIMQYIFQDKTYNNMFRYWIKKDENKKVEEIREKERLQEAKEIKIRQAEKNKKRKEKSRQRASEIQKEACLNALKEYFNNFDFTKAPEKLNIGKIICESRGTAE